MRNITVLIGVLICCIGMYLILKGVSYDETFSFITGGIIIYIGISILEDKNDNSPY